LCPSHGINFLANWGNVDVSRRTVPPLRVFRMGLITDRRSAFLRFASANCGAFYSSTAVAITQWSEITDVR
jgi:hypothetical protein